jgi:hypothetical protein
MSQRVRRPLLAVTTAFGGIITALSLSSATASADAYSIGPAPSIYDLPAPEVISISGMPPFDLTATEAGWFGIVNHLPDGGTLTDVVNGVLNETQSFGFTNQLLVVDGVTNPVVPANSVIDLTNFGGYENVYIDAVGQGAQGSNDISDTLVTPFGEVDIPTTFDASAFLSLSEPGAAAAALDADWASFIALF